MTTPGGIESVQLIPADIDKAIGNRNWGRNWERTGRRSSNRGIGRRNSNRGGPEGRAGGMATSCGTESVQPAVIRVDIDLAVGNSWRETPEKSY
jgi:hypothetical protein